MLEGSLLIDVVLPSVLAVVMVGIGLTLQIEDFARQRERPAALGGGARRPAAGRAAVGFLVVAIFNPPPALAIGLVLVAATSGGTTSNVMTYLARDNVALGLVLTSDRGRLRRRRVRLAGAAVGG